MHLVPQHDETPAAMLTSVSCGVFAAEDLIAALASEREPVLREFDLADAEAAFAVLAGGGRVSLRP